MKQFDRRAADFIIFMFAYWGVSQLVMCPVFIVILWRYNSLIPFMCLLIFSEWALRFYIARDSKIHSAKIKKYSLIWILLYCRERSNSNIFQYCRKWWNLHSCSYSSKKHMWTQHGASTIGPVRANLKTPTGILRCIMPTLCLILFWYSLPY